LAFENKHTINRINATINCRNNDLSEIRKRSLASDIENAMEAISPILDLEFGIKETVRIEALSLELNVSTEQLSTLSKLLTDALSDILRKFEKEKYALPEVQYQEARAYTREEVFFYFMENGRMPWFSVKLELEKIDTSNAAFKTQLIALLKSSSKVRERFVDQSSAEELRQLASMLYPDSYVRKLFDFIELISQNSGKFSNRFAAGFRIRQKIIKAALDYIQEAPESRQFIDFLRSYWPSFVPEVEKECNGKNRDFLQFLKTESNLNFDFELPVEELAETNSLATDETVSKEIKNRISAKDEIPADIFKEGNPEAEQMVVNAGIVLLHPFIKRFFKKVGLLENDRFISPDHQQRGICLLHYLATGETVFPEEELLLLKHLCNYPLQRPVPRELPISEFERTEAGTVLEAAIAHWTALKRTSVEGLRINFLQRKGLLEKDAMGYTLHVETHAADVLLDQLPWGLSVVHFPWLPDLLTLKWR